MNNIIIRVAELKDIDGLIEIECEKWKLEIAAGKQKWESRIRIFPEGTKVALKNGQIVGVVVSHIINLDYSDGNYLTWAEATANGYITNHCDTGNIVYGVNLTVLKDNPRVASMLVRENLKIPEKRKIATLIGGRIPTLYRKGKAKDDFTEKDVIMYAKRDPTIRFFISLGFVVIGAMKDYMPDDDESLGWGIMVEKK
ncbi:hypothetical protein KAU09_04910 [Candidatus Parcubacteria bacterium]|nr:hypothetical protein [Candidatus Parcubacteria bacterium]